MMVVGAMDWYATAMAIAGETLEWIVFAVGNKLQVDPEICCLVSGCLFRSIWDIASTYSRASTRRHSHQPSLNQTQTRDKPSRNKQSNLPKQ